MRLTEPVKHPATEAIARLAGSSPPTGAPPGFQPIATSGDAVHDPAPSTIDPVFAAIEAHRAAYDAFGALCVRQDGGGESRSEKAERKAADSAETNAFLRLATTEPLTLPGLLAFSAHLSAYLAGDAPPQECQAAAMASIAAASQKLLHRDIAAAAAAHSSASATPPINDAVGYAILRRPRMRSGKERLTELVGEYERLISFDCFAGHAAEDENGTDESREKAKNAEDHADRMMSEIELMVEGIPASDIVDLGLKARILSWTAKTLWEDRGHQDHGVRNLVDDILTLAGMDRIRPRDFQLTELLPDYAGPERHNAMSVAVEPQGPVPPPRQRKLCDGRQGEEARSLARDAASDQVAA